MLWKDIIPGDIVIRGFYLSPQMAQLVISVALDKKIPDCVLVVSLLLWGGEGLLKEKYRLSTRAIWEDNDFVIRDGVEIARGHLNLKYHGKCR